MKPRQEVLNVLLAQLLQEKGLVAAPEQIIKGSPKKSRSMPDVLVDFQGLRLAIEGEYGVTKASKKKAGDLALSRVEEGIAHVGVAILYNNELKLADFQDLKEDLSNSVLTYAIVTESKATAMEQLNLFPTKSNETLLQFVEGGIDSLGEALRRAYEELIKDEVLDRAVKALETSVARFTFALSIQPATTKRFARVLGVKEAAKKKGKA